MSILLWLPPMDDGYIGYIFDQPAKLMGVSLNIFNRLPTIHIYMYINITVADPGGGGGGGARPPPPFQQNNKK